MAISILMLVVAALLIYYSCNLFVNGIEWVGRKFKVSDNAVGTVLAAFGTALPESIVTFIAVVFGQSPGQREIGVGAALGGPLILSTVAYSIVGLCTVIFYRKNAQEQVLCINGEKLARDQLWFLSIFIFNAVLGLINFNGKIYMGFLLLIAYGLYCYKEMSVKIEEEQEELLPLLFQKRTSNPDTGWVIFQTALSLVLIFIGSDLFVKQIGNIGAMFNIPSHIVALFLSPIATELPETLNAIIWIRQGKITLALSNISGSMMVQATIPSAIGILCTPWIFDSYLLMAVISTLASIGFLWMVLKKRCLSAQRLIFAAAFYMVFVTGTCLIKSGILGG